jgi:hypothetical protein
LRRSCVAASLASILTTALEHGKGTLCKPLARSNGSLATLAAPLLALAQEPGDQQPILAHFLDAMEKVLQWTASVSGLEGLELLTQQLVHPALGALDALLEAEPGGPNDAACIIY